MLSEDLIDPELMPFLATLPRVALSIDALPAIRESMKAMPERDPPRLADDVQVESRMVPGPKGTPPIRVVGYRPNAQGPIPGLLHFHGGGFVLGSPDMADAANRRLAAALGCAIFSVDYRLAPETIYPGQIEDCYAVFLWVHANAEQVGVDSACIGVKGESAGGGLAAALALLARDRAGPRLAFQHLIYPMLDNRTLTDNDFNPFTGQVVWTRADNEVGWSALLGGAPGASAVSPYAAAARAEDLKGLPPTFIGVGSLDLFLDENLSYAGRLVRAGVPVELHVYPGAFHRFYEARGTRLAKTAESDSDDALRRAMHGGTTDAGGASHAV